MLTHIYMYSVSIETCSLKIKLTEPAIMATELARKVTMADRAIRLSGYWPGFRLPHTTIHGDVQANSILDLYPVPSPASSPPLPTATSFDKKL